MTFAYVCDVLACLVMVLGNVAFVAIGLAEHSLRDRDRIREPD